jgi:dTDP-4-dehydrorhamnose reductase
MRILVTGGSGFVGWHLVTHLRDAGHVVSYTYRSTVPTIGSVDEQQYQVDIRDNNAVEEMILSFDPAVVVHAAALTDADTCERNPDLAHAVNVTGTRHVVEACERTNASIVFISSSFVFDGEMACYSEDDSRSAVNEYGMTKIRAEKIVSAADIPTLIIRLDQPYYWLPSWREHTFVTWVLDQLQDGTSFPVFDDWYNRPLFIPDHSAVIAELLNRKETGIYHVVGPEYMSRYEWARTVADVFGYDPALIRRGNSSDTDLAAQRPNTNLLNEKVVSQLNYQFTTVRQGLERMNAEVDSVR